MLILKNFATISPKINRHCFPPRLYRSHQGVNVPALKESIKDFSFISILWEILSVLKKLLNSVTLFILRGNTSSKRYADFFTKILYLLRNGRSLLFVFFSNL